MGREIEIARDLLLPFDGQHELEEQFRRVRVRGALHHADHVRVAGERLEPRPGDRGALLGADRGMVVEDHQPDRKLAGDHLIEHDALGCGDVDNLVRRQRLEVGHSRGLAFESDDVLDESRWPVDRGVGRPGHLAGPFGVEKIVKALGDISAFDKVGVVAGGHEIDVERRPGAVGIAQLGGVALRGFHQVALNQARVAERKHGVGAVEDVGLDAPGPGLAGDLQRNVGAGRAGILHLDPGIFLLEGECQRACDLVDDQCRIPDYLAFLARSLDQGGIGARGLHRSADRHGQQGQQNSLHRILPPAVCAVATIKPEARPEFNLQAMTPRPRSRSISASL